MHKLVLLSVFVAVLFTAMPVLAETYTNTYTKDGKTYITTKTATEEKIIIETKIYDANGTLLETKVVEKDPKPSPVKEVTYPTKTITPPVTKALLPTATPVVKVIEETSEPVVKTVLQTKYPMYVNKDSGKLVVKTESKEVELKTNPEEIVEKSKKEGMDIIVDVTLEESSGKLNYVVSGSKLEKLLAIFQIPLETKLVYDPGTGKLVDSVQSGWTKVADFFSI